MNEARYFLVYEDGVEQLSGLRGRDLVVLLGCCCVAGFGGNDFTLRRNLERLMGFTGMSRGSLYVSLGRLVRADYLVRGKRGSYVVNPYVCYKGSTRGRRALMKEIAFRDVRLPVGGKGALVPNEEF